MTALGLNNPKTQNKLLNTEDLTFEKACSIAKTMEMADRNTQEFHPSNSDTIQVNKLTEQGKENTDKIVSQMSPFCFCPLEYDNHICWKYVSKWKESDKLYTSLSANTIMALLTSHV